MVGYCTHMSRVHYHQKYQIFITTSKQVVPPTFCKLQRYIVIYMSVQEVIYLTITWYALEPWKPYIATIFLSEVILQLNWVIFSSLVVVQNNTNVFTLSFIGKKCTWEGSENMEHGTGKEYTTHSELQKVFAFGTNWINLIDTTNNVPSTTTEAKYYAW